MMVLSRKKTEAVVIPQCGIVLRVLAIKGGAVRLGISAPDDVQIYRQEVWESTQSQNPLPVEVVFLHKLARNNHTRRNDVPHPRHYSSSGG